MYHNTLIFGHVECPKFLKSDEQINKSEKNSHFLRHSRDKTFRSTKIFRQREISNEMLGLWSKAEDKANSTPHYMKILAIEIYVHQFSIKGCHLRVKKSLIP